MIHRTGPSPGAALVILLCAALALSAVLAPASHEGREPAPNDGAEPRVLLIGLDAADWIMLDRWIEQGELPHLARLARTGLRGDLRTLRPIISPLVWTSIATGQTPDRHGVTDFFSGRDRENGLRPVSRHSVSVPTLWEILSDRGLDVAITAWWASWPADPTLNGRVVTDQVQFIFPGPVQGADPDSALYHPPDLAGRLDHCLVSPETLDARAVSAIAPCTTADLAPGADDPAPALLRRSLAATTTYYRMTREMLLDGQPRFTAIYFLGTDTVAHLYGQAAASDPGYYAPLRYYRLVDAMVGDLCALVDRQTMVVLVSDHGFYTEEDRPSGDSSDFHHQAAAWHRPLGMVLFNAPWIKAGRLADASVLDIAPTLLWQLLGERFDTLPGRVLVEERPKTHGTAETHRRSLAPAGGQASEGPSVEATDRYLAQLRALGYLGDGYTENAPTARPVIHLADYLQWAGRPAEALEQLEQARDRLGEDPELLVRLTIQRSRAGDPSGAMAALSTALDQGWNPAAASRLVTAVGICCAAGRLERAEKLLDGLAPPAVSSPQGLTARSVVAESRGRLQEAVDGYAAALEVDPASGYAARRICRLLSPDDSLLLALGNTVRQVAVHRTGDTPVQLNAGRLLLAAGDPESALEPLGRAVHLEPDRPDLRLLLGQALYQSGRPMEAFERLAEGLAWHPSHPRLLAAAGAAAIRAGYVARGMELLERAVAAGATGPHLEAALNQAHQFSGR